MISKYSMRGFGFDRKNCFTIIYNIFMGVLVHISEFYVHILGNSLSLRIYAFLRCVHADCIKTQKKAVKEKARGIKLQLQTVCFSDDSFT